MSSAARNTIWVLVEQDSGEATEASLEALTAARNVAGKIGGTLNAITFGGDLALGPQGVAATTVVSHDLLPDYSPDGWAAAIEELTGGAAAVVAAGTERGNEIMAHVGAMSGQPMVANCTEIAPGEPAWQLVRIRWGGSLLENTELEAPRKLVTVAPHAVPAEPADQPGAGEVVHHSPAFASGAPTVIVSDRVTTTTGITLATAPVVVSGGRGVGSEEGFAQLEDLAGLLGGVVGCSRVVTNNGWRSHNDQVGQTGTVVAPDLYIACGISGAIQHWVGMKSSKKILAINTDEQAPMVTKADYAVLGDLHEIVPAITDEIRRRQG